MSSDKGKDQEDGSTSSGSGGKDHIATATATTEIELKKVKSSTTKDSSSGGNNNTVVDEQTNFEDENISDDSDIEPEFGSTTTSNHHHAPDEHDHEYDEDNEDHYQQGTPEIGTPSVVQSPWKRFKNSRFVRFLEQSNRTMNEGPRKPVDGEDVDVKERALTWGWRTFQFFALSLRAVGVVYGDIGTSPLYVYQTIFSDLGSWQDDDVLGATSLILYTLIIVVLIKYCVFILTADQNGEGGIVALLSLVPPEERKHYLRKHRGTLKPWPRWVHWIKNVCFVIGMMGACLLLGDGGITPAISVLSAIEGIGVVWSDFGSIEIPVGIVIILIIFIYQAMGTGKIGMLFGPIICLWFISLTIIGIINIVSNPHILLAWNPYYMIRWFQNNGTEGFWLLGDIILCGTGAEALYADIGHFGKWPVRFSFATFVLPSISIAYLGHGAVLLSHPEYIKTGTFFYQAMPRSVLYPMLVLATASAIIASQAIISGSFSLVSQAIQQGLFPSVNVVHTSKRLHGQIYVPVVNWTLMIFCIWLIVYFQNSTAMGNAYAFAVTGTIGCTTILFVTRLLLKWPLFFWIILPVGLLLFGIDLIFFSSTLRKIPNGGWVPLVVALVLFVALFCWWRGREDVKRTNRELMGSTTGRLLTTDKVILWLKTKSKIGKSRKRVNGTGVFIEDSKCPKTVVLYRRAMKNLPKRIIITRLKFYPTPVVPDRDQIKVIDMGNGLYMMTLRLGFAVHDVNVEDIIKKAENFGLIPKKKKDDMRCFISNEVLVNTMKRRFWISWRLGVYNWLAQSLESPAALRILHVEDGRLISIGSTLEINHPNPNPGNFITRFFNK